MSAGPWSYVAAIEAGGTQRSLATRAAHVDRSTIMQRFLTLELKHEWVPRKQRIQRRVLSMYWPASQGRHKRPHSKASSFLLRTSEIL